jgi:hypothetical protein
MPIVQVRPWVERWQTLGGCRNGVHTFGQDAGTEDAACQTRAAMAFSRALHSPFSRTACVMDSSVYHLASALIGRCVGRMTP